jgi:hypothetical protein
VFTLVLDAPDVGAARLRLAGHLDGQAARDVLHAAADVVRSGCSRLVLDLDALVSWDDDATYAVVGCTRLARWLPGGVDVVGGPLQRALVPPQLVTAPPAARGPARRRADPAGPDTMAACHAS